MQPKKPRFEQADMITLGGWLFADLLLGLALFFFAANTTGAPPPTPIPSATPDLLATEQARGQGELAAANAAATAAAQAAQRTALALNVEVAQGDESLATAAARATQDALFRGQATSTAQAMATRAAMSAAQRATADAQATQNVLAAEATIAAFATQQAQSASNIDQLTREQATAAAEANLQAQSAAATIAAQGTEAAGIAAIATENARSGANVLATANAQGTQVSRISAVATENALGGANALATAQAQAIAAQATIQAANVNQLLTADQLATAQAGAGAISATVAALSTQQAGAVATATVLSAELIANSLDPTARETEITTDLNGMIRGDEGALEATREQLRQVLAPYATGCKAGVVLISGNADLGPGNDLARVVEGLLRNDFATIFTDDTGYERFAQPGQQPAGGVQLKIYFNTGCEPAAG